MNKNVFYVLAVVFVILAVYYAVPGVHHVFASGDANAAHYKHVILFIGLALISVAASRVFAKGKVE